MMISVQYDLYLTQPGMSPIRFPLTGQRVVLGAALGCDLSLEGDDQILDTHAVLVHQQTGWIICPLPEAGVFKNGQRLHGETELSIDETVEIGDWSIQLRGSTDTDTGDTLEDKTKVLGEGARASVGPYIVRWTAPDGQMGEHKLKDERVIIGKSSLCDIVLEDDYVSSRHCELYWDGDQVMLRDLGSTNGTKVAGMQVRELRLEPGAEILCGKTSLVFAVIERTRRLRSKSHSWTVPLLGQAPAFTQLARQIERVAPLSQNVFIHGETGTGKELVAAALHELSLRKDRPFIALNCGAISKELMESELFGHEKGAFTGAQQRRAGAFELASGGTLFLDEVGELPLELQPKLLRVLETGRFRRVGGREELQVDVRVFSATHRDLTEAIRMGRFREDLYYRLYILPVELPTLRQRLEDIPLLIDFFVEQACPADRPMTVASDVCALLKTHEWPGNIRELRNLVYRALAFCEGSVLRKEHFLPFFKPTRAAADERGDDAPAIRALSPIKQKEREAIVEILRACDGNQSVAAKKLGIGRTTLYYKIKEYGIDMRRQAMM